MESVGLEDCERLAVGGGLEVGSQGEWWGIFLPLFEKMQWIAAGGSIFSSQYPVPTRNWSDGLRKESGFVRLSSFVHSVFLYMIIFVVLPCSLLRNSVLFRCFV